MVHQWRDHVQKARQPSSLPRMILQDKVRPGGSEQGRTLPSYTETWIGQTLGIVSGHPDTFRMWRLAEAPSCWSKPRSYVYVADHMKYLHTESAEHTP